MNLQPPDPPEEDEGERFEHELYVLRRAAENLADIDAGKSQQPVADAVAEFHAAAYPRLIVWLFEDRQRQEDEYDKAWRRDLCDKNNVQVLAAEVAKLRQIISECATACGAAVSVECTTEFMQLLPGEIRLLKEKTEKLNRLLAHLEQLP